MNSIIDNKIFDLITKSENFEIAFDINERYADIVYRLDQEFWNLLLKKVKSNFKINVLSDTDRLWEFEVIPKGWEKFVMFFRWDDKEDKVYYGVGTDKLKTKKQQDMIHENLEELLVDFEVIKGNFEIWFKYPYGDDFEKLSGLKKILPETREKTVDRYYLIFTTFLEMLSKKIIQTESKLKKI